MNVGLILTNEMNDDLQRENGIGSMTEANLLMLSVLGTNVSSLLCTHVLTVLVHGEDIFWAPRTVWKRLWHDSFVQLLITRVRNAVSHLQMPKRDACECVHYTSTHAPWANCLVQYRPTGHAGSIGISMSRDLNRSPLGLVPSKGDSSLVLYNLDIMGLWEKNWKFNKKKLKSNNWYGFRNCKEIVK